MTTSKDQLAAIVSAALFSLGVAETSEATLLSRLDGRAVYDTDRDITWTADANLAASNTFGIDDSLIGADGAMTWYTAEWEWLPAMNAYEGIGYLGFNDWRLPTTLQPDFACTQPFAGGLGSVGYNCVGSEMGHLFYQELGGAKGVSILDSGDPDVALFANLRQTGERTGYWSGTGNPHDETFAYYFLFDNNFATSESLPLAGMQSSGPKYNTRTWAAWAVRDGDVLTVPEPAMLGLFSAGLAGIWLVRRVKKTRAGVATGPRVRLHRSSGAAVGRALSLRRSPYGRSPRLRRATSA